jgi:hypothetical protein
MQAAYDRRNGRRWHVPNAQEWRHTGTASLTVVSLVLRQQCLHQIVLDSLAQSCALSMSPTHMPERTTYGRYTQGEQPIHSLR